MHGLAIRQANALTLRRQDELMALVRLGSGGRARAVPEPVASVPQHAAAGRMC
jgi:hypothetical protein